MAIDELRPSNLSEIIGNENLKKCLMIIVKAAKIQNRALPHTIFHGHYGCGKTTCARALAGEMKSKFIEINGPSIKKNKDILEIIGEITPNSILFIDEIHGVKTKHAEMLYSLMEDFKAYMPVSDEGGHIVSLDVPQFTLVGATTNLGALSGPLLTRFKQNHNVKPYKEEEIEQIIIANSKKLGLSFKEGAAAELSRRCKNVPRYANNRLSWIRDYCVAENKTYVNIADINTALEMIGIDDRGFDQNDRMYLEAIQKFQPIGLTNLAAVISSTPETVVKFIEPPMLSRGMIDITREGRTIKGFIKSKEEQAEIISNLSPDDI